MTLDEVNKLSLLDVDQMYGIELEEFPARIAETALWLADHQANVALGLLFTQNCLRFPLRKIPHNHVANALRKDWREVLPPEQCSYVLGNPPFVGSKYLGEAQRADMNHVWDDVKGAGVLDLVTAWYRKATKYMHVTLDAFAFLLGVKYRSDPTQRIWMVGGDAVDVVTQLPSYGLDAGDAAGITKEGGAPGGGPDRPAGGPEPDRRGP